MGSEDNKSYIDDFVGTLLPFLSENKDNIACILMGYGELIENNILNTNKGLKRRFPNILTIKDYSINELKNILISKIDEYKWYYEDDALPIKLFKQHQDMFTDNGGSMENLFKYIKLSHSKRVLYMSPEQKKTINYEDFKIGLDMYVKNHKNHTNNYELSQYNSIYT